MEKKTETSRDYRGCIEFMWGYMVYIGVIFRMKMAYSQRLPGDPG